MLVKLNAFLSSVFHNVTRTIYLRLLICSNRILTLNSFKSLLLKFFYILFQEGQRVFFFVCKTEIILRLKYLNESTLVNSNKSKSVRVKKNNFYPKNKQVPHLKHFYILLFSFVSSYSFTCSSSSVSFIGFYIWEPTISIILRFICFTFRGNIMKCLLIKM